MHSPFFLWYSETEEADDFQCRSIAERGILVVARHGLLGVRRDLGRTLLLESMLQAPVASDDDVVRLELPHNEVWFVSPDEPKMKSTFFLEHSFVFYVKADANHSCSYQDQL